MTSASFIVTLVIGGVIGWLATALMRTNARMGVSVNVILGVAGSAIAILIASSLGVRAGRPPVDWMVAILGAALLIALVRALGLFNRAPRAH